MAGRSVVGAPLGSAGRVVAVEKAEAEGSIDMTRKSSRMNGHREERSPPFVLAPWGVAHAASVDEAVQELEVRQLCARKKGHPEEERVSAWPTTTLGGCGGGDGRRGRGAAMEAAARR